MLYVNVVHWYMFVSSEIFAPDFKRNSRRIYLKFFSENELVVYWLPQNSIMEIDCVLENVTPLVPNTFTHFCREIWKIVHQSTSIFSIRFRFPYTNLHICQDTFRRPVTPIWQYIHLLYTFLPHLYIFTFLSFQVNNKSTFLFSVICHFFLIWTTHENQNIFFLCQNHKTKYFISFKINETIYLSFL